jgi:ribosome-binding factor A
MPEQSSHRVQRINELILRELVTLLKQKTKDPRLHGVTITDVISTRDLSSAKVFYTVTEENKSIVGPLLDKASGFFRTSLSKKLNLRHTPAIRFIFDPAPNTGAKIEELLSKI